MHFMSFILHFTKSKVVTSEEFNVLKVDGSGSGRSWRWKALKVDGPLSSYSFFERLSETRLFIKYIEYKIALKLVLNPDRA